MKYRSWTPALTEATGGAPATAKLDSIGTFVYQVEA